MDPRLRNLSLHLQGEYGATHQGAQVQPNGYVVKCSGPLPAGSEFVRYGEQAFKYWTVEDAQAFLEGEAVNPWLPKANLRKN